MTPWPPSPMSIASPMRSWPRPTSCTASGQPAGSRGPRGSGAARWPRPRRAPLYTVRRGDTLVTIADRFGVSLTQLRRWNKMTGIRVEPGQPSARGRARWPRSARSRSSHMRAQPQRPAKPSPLRRKRRPPQAVRTRRKNMRAQVQLRAILRLRQKRKIAHTRQRRGQNRLRGKKCTRTFDSTTCLFIAIACKLLIQSLPRAECRFSSANRRTIEGSGHQLEAIGWKKCSRCTR